MSKHLVSSVHSRWQGILPKAAVCLGLALLIFGVFGQTSRFDFFNYDDDRNVYAEPHVTSGLSLRNIRWAFAHTQVDRWTPIATLTRQLDCQIYGLHAGGHHTTNVIIHLFATIALFFALITATKAVWRSAFVAALFAIHPLHVEPVAWISDRNELLSGLFFICSIWAYAVYARSTHSRRAYVISIAAFILGLMSKPNIVTLPFVLLVLDYWPLRRLQEGPKRLILEKIPFFLLSVASGVLAFLITRNAGISDTTPFSLRIENATVSYTEYLAQTIWPVDLAPFYPYPLHGFSIVIVGLSLALLIVISTIASRRRRSYPSLIAGWLWFLGMLVPVIGIVQFSICAHADRYMYLPQIGLLVGVVWSVTEWAAARRYSEFALTATSTVILSTCFVAARHQASFWRDSLSLWDHTIRSTSENYLAQNNLGVVLGMQGRLPEALEHCHKALQLNPNYADAHTNIALILARSGQIDEAIEHYHEALALNPRHPIVHNNLANALARKGETELAIYHYRKAIEIEPDYTVARNNLANALLSLGRTDEAIEQYRKTLQSDPSFKEATTNLNAALQKKQKLAR